MHLTAKFSFVDLRLLDDHYLVGDLAEVRGRVHVRAAKLRGKFLRSQFATGGRCQPLHARPGQLNQQHCPFFSSSTASLSSLSGPDGGAVSCDRYGCTCTLFCPFHVRTLRNKEGCVVPPRRSASVATRIVYMYVVYPYCRVISPVSGVFVLVACRVWHADTHIGQNSGGFANGDPQRGVKDKMWDLVEGGVPNLKIDE